MVVRCTDDAEMEPTATRFMREATQERNAVLAGPDAGITTDTGAPPAPRRHASQRGTSASASRTRANACGELGDSVGARRSGPRLYTKVQRQKGLGERADHGTAISKSSARGPRSSAGRDDGSTAAQVRAAS